MKFAFRAAQVVPAAGALAVHVELENRSADPWTRDCFALGWQLFDPATNRFIAHGEWIPPASPVAPGASAVFDFSLSFAPEPGDYHIYVSPLDPARGWAYARGSTFLLIAASAAHGAVTLRRWEFASTLRLRLRNLRHLLPVLLASPFASPWRSRRLISSLVRRDILARYRGSFAGAFWTLLNPLLLMTTYFFVFGVVLRTRFGADSSGSGYVLYFLAGMLPWLAVSEAAGRAPNTIPEYRGFVRKLVFPLETLNVVQTASGLVTEFVGMAIFLAGLLLARGAVSSAILWLPAIVIPQLLFTLGLCWFLAALGAFIRDLGQIIGFLLTLWFFLTPICYPEASLPKSAAALLSKNPMFFLVRAYRSVLLEGRAPDLHALGIFSAFALATLLAGHAWFYKLRKSFADVV